MSFIYWKFKLLKYHVIIIMQNLWITIFKESIDFYCFSFLCQWYKVFALLTMFKRVGSWLILHLKLIKLGSYFDIKTQNVDGLFTKVIKHLLKILIILFEHLLLLQKFLFTNQDLSWVDWLFMTMNCIFSRFLSQDSLSEYVVSFLHWPFHFFLIWENFTDLFFYWILFLFFLSVTIVLTITSVLSVSTFILELIHKFFYHLLLFLL